MRSVWWRTRSVGSCFYNSRCEACSYIHLDCEDVLNVCSLKSLTGPLLILHSEDDNIVPHHMGQKVQQDFNCRAHVDAAASSLIYFAFFLPPVVPNIPSDSERREQRWSGPDDLLQWKSGVLSQQHLPGSQPVQCGQVSFMWDRHYFTMHLMMICKN